MDSSNAPIQPSSNKAHLASNRASSQALPHPISEQSVVPDKRPELSIPDKLLFGVHLPCTVSVVWSLLIVNSLHPLREGYILKTAGAYKLAFLPVVFLFLFLAGRLNYWILWLPLRSRLTAILAGAGVPAMALLAVHWFLHKYGHF
jgi:hypothetical protein